MEYYDYDLNSWRESYISEYGDGLRYGQGPYWTSGVVKSTRSFNSDRFRLKTPCQTTFVARRFRVNLVN